LSNSESVPIDAQDNIFKALLGVAEGLESRKAEQGMEEDDLAVGLHCLGYGVVYGTLAIFAHFDGYLLTPRRELSNRQTQEVHKAFFKIVGEP
jgi:hypothetical protein